MGTVILDVRERDEFDAEHIEGSINVPLSVFGSMAPGVLNQLKERKVEIMCRGGNRAKLAFAQIQNLGFSDKVDASVYAGGIMAWKEAGRPTVAAKKGHLPIMRQVQLAAGLLVLTGVVLGFSVAPGFFGIAAFVGLGLTVAGSTGFCGMAQLLAHAPWNKHNPTNREELCQVSPSGSDCKS